MIVAPALASGGRSRASTMCDGATGIFRGHQRTAQQWTTQQRGTWRRARGDLRAGLAAAGRAGTAGRDRLAAPAVASGDRQVLPGAAGADGLPLPERG